MLAVILMAGMATAADWTAAQTQWQRYLEETEGVHKAMAAQDSNGANEHQAQARAALLKARELYEQGKVLKADEPDSHAAYAQVLGALGYDDLAAEALRRALEAEPGNAAWWLRLGKHLSNCDLPRRREAVGALREALRLDSGGALTAEAHTALGDVFFAEGLYSFAGEDYAKAIAAKANHVPAAIALAALDARRGDLVKAWDVLHGLGKAVLSYDVDARVKMRAALAEFDDARLTFEDTAANHGAYARLLYQAARPVDAVLAAKRALQLDEEDHETWNFMAAVQSQLGSLEGARHAYEKSLEVYPDQPAIRQAMKRLEAAAKAQQTGTTTQQ